MMNSRFKSLNFWRGWALVSSAVALVALAIALSIALRPLLTTEPAASGADGARIGYVAVLHDQTSQLSTLLITWDDRHSVLTLYKLASYPLQSNQALQLWGLPAALGNPVSLGVIRANARYSVHLQERPQNYPVLAVSVEPSGGSPNLNGPMGPVVYTGKLVPIS
jgi:anti-sigma-K factor RskA